MAKWYSLKRHWKRWVGVEIADDVADRWTTEHLGQAMAGDLHREKMPMTYSISGNRLVMVTAFPGELVRVWDCEIRRTMAIDPATQEVVGEDW